MIPDVAEIKDYLKSMVVVFFLVFSSFVTFCLGLKICNDSLGPVSLFSPSFLRTNISGENQYLNRWVGGRLAKFPEFCSGFVFLAHSGRDLR